jgi:hypothetical protein
MPLPTTRHTLPNVDCAGDQRPGADPCPDTKVDCLLWRREFADREIRIRLVRYVRRQNIRSVFDVVAASTQPRQTHGDRVGQRPIPPCQATRAAAAQIPQSADAPIPAAIQPAVGANRTSLETHSAIGHPQPALRDTWRCARRRTEMLQSVDETQLGAEETMRRYLRRYV